jgi:hypothetical protein
MTTEYDEVVRSAKDRESGKSLPDFNPIRQELITYRKLFRLRRPHLFYGKKQIHPLAEILVTPRTGGFVHPGERELLEKVYQKFGGGKKGSEQHNRGVGDICSGVG